MRAGSASWHCFLVGLSGSAEVAEKSDAPWKCAIERNQVLRLAQAPGERPPGQIWNRFLERCCITILECRDERDLAGLEPGCHDQIDQSPAPSFRDRTIGGHGLDKYPSAK